MFAVLLSKKMDPIYDVILTFPTVVFTVALLVCLVYWLFAMLGAVDLDFLNIDVPDGDIDVDVDMDVSGHGDVGPAAGVLIKFGLTSIPFVITFTGLSVFGFLTSCALVHYGLHALPEGILQSGLSIVVFIASLILGMFITSVVLSPLKPVFKAMRESDEKIIVGRIGVVRSSKLSEDKAGEVYVDDGGAGLLLKGIAYEGEGFVKGDRVALVEHDQEKNIYRVVSEKEFNS